MIFFRKIPKNSLDKPSTLWYNTHMKKIEYCEMMGDLYDEIVKVLDGDEWEGFEAPELTEADLDAWAAEYDEDQIMRDFLVDPKD